MMSAHPKPLDLQHLVAAALACNGPIIEERGLSVEQDLGPRPVWVRGGDSRLLHALAHVIDVACRGSRAGAAIHIDALPSGQGLVALSVRDEGRGAAADRWAMAADPWADEGQAPNRLQTVRRIVESHGGRVMVCSDGSDRGGETILTLPLQPSPRHAPFAGQRR